MNIEDRLHAVALLRCHRCDQSAVHGLYVGIHLLCPACLVDFEWFLEHPPEMPDSNSSSDMLPETEEVRT